MYLLNNTAEKHHWVFPYLSDCWLAYLHLLWFALPLLNSSRNFFPLRDSLFLPGAFESERWRLTMTQQTGYCGGVKGGASTSARCRHHWPRSSRYLWLEVFWKCALSVWISSPLHWLLNQDFIKVTKCGLCFTDSQSWCDNRKRKTFFSCGCQILCTVVNFRL